MSEVSCPICANNFLDSAIQEHVNKCLFLHETSTTSLRPPKRENVNTVDNPVNKKSKTNTNDGNNAPIFASSPARQKKAQSSNQNPVINTPEKSFTKTSSETKRIPLAERIRPKYLFSFVGQTHVLNENCILYELLNKGEVPNFILWGPPGCGKTSLANIVANMCKIGQIKSTRFVKLSAALVGVGEVKEQVQVASNELKFGRKTVIFMDEIHRFNKMQQDIFLPHVESGTIKLIGATTENPSFSLNSALLSRCRVIVMEKLSIKDVIEILKNGVKHLEGFIIDLSKKTEESTDSKFSIDRDTIEWLAETCDGDARIALGGLELAVQSKLPSDEQQNASSNVTILLKDVQDSLKKSHQLYDRKGDQHYDIISALHKSVRASDDNAAIYWLARMLAGGEDPVYIARRLVRMASEDIGLANPHALGIAVSTMQGCQMIGMPECDVLLAQCVTYLARAPKSRLMEDALRSAQMVIADQKGPQPGVPLHLRNAHTKLMKNLGYGKNYNMLHKDVSGLSYLPEGMEDLDFFE